MLSVTFMDFSNIKKSLHTRTKAKLDLHLITCIVSENINTSKNVW